MANITCSEERPAMCINLDWTIVITENSSSVLDRNHLTSMAQEDLQHTADRISFFLDVVTGMITEVEWNDGHAAIFPIAPNEEDRSADAIDIADNEQNDDWSDSFVPANDPSDDADWQMEDLLALLNDLGRIGHQGITEIDLKAGTCNLSDGTIVRMTDRDSLIERVNNHLGLLESAAMFKTGFPIIHSSNHVLRLNTERILDIKHGTAIALTMMNLRLAGYRPA
ncbi:hypothetical protein [Bifidobacterium felsineum]|uniref:hypothetical protein n=1 Tax=Bifidobacterium felsineum TaxID=2045440 RepID=UPI001BDD8567|nr:hypothetical protein [Bifidobacterium felsineum]MBT1163758.1 hypothetical protein [Bifidobacterium felsineum]